VGLLPGHRGPVRPRLRRWPGRRRTAAGEPGAAPRRRSEPGRSEGTTLTC